ncbi:hypothetical protein GCM10009850_112890 [Nonomuraea monospora]|uniref:Secreted protein n=1 Tax=Nonomuraea monospora TaxID=568818 RepID=A0ABN3D2M0_9ACTN
MASPLPEVRRLKSVSAFKGEAPTSCSRAAGPGTRWAPRLALSCATAAAAGSAGRSPILEANADRNDWRNVLFFDRPVPCFLVPVFTRAVCAVPGAR